MPSVLHRVKGIWFASTLLVSAYIGTFLYITPLLPLLFLVPHLFLSIMDSVACVWFQLVTAFMELVCGIRFVITGDALPPHENCLIISNHRTRLDWMFLWSFAMRRLRLYNYKIVLKSQLKKVPGAGWAMQGFRFLFLSRVWSKDSAHMHTLLSSFSQSNYPLQLLIFPEGTDLSYSNKQKSHIYAEKSGLAKYEYVLHPRVKGFQQCVTSLTNVHAVYDLTIGYLPHVPPNEHAFLDTSKFCREVHIYVKRYPVDRVGKNEDEQAAWLKQVWAEKEKRLEHFYKDNRFDQSTSTAGDKPPMLTHLVSLLFWMATIFCGFYLLYSSLYFRYYFLFANIGWLILTSFFGGVDHLAVLATRRRYGKEVKKEE